MAQAAAQKKSAEEALANLKERIAAAKQTHVAAEEAAKEAETAAAPLQAEAEKTRAAYRAAKNIADDKRALVNQLKANADYEAAEKAAKEAEAAHRPFTGRHATGRQGLR